MRRSPVLDRRDLAAPSAVARELVLGVDESSLDALLDLRPGEALRARLETALLGPAREILARPGKHLRARLVEAGWQAAAPSRAPEPPPTELGLAVEVLHAASLVVDDVEDDSSWRRGGPALHHRVGLPIALNTGTFLYFWPFALLRRIPLPADRELECTRRLSDTLLRGHAGQALDLGVVVDSLPASEVREVVAASTELKTGALVELALSLPAAARGATAATEALARCGRVLGIALQMLDDLGNLAAERAPEKFGEDLRHGRPTWPWAWLADDVERFETFRPRAAAARSGKERLEKLAGDLLREVGERGRAEATARMGTAVARLEETLERPAPGVRDVVETLERAYV